MINFHVPYLNPSNSSRRNIFVLLLSVIVLLSNDNCHNTPKSIAMAFVNEERNVYNLKPISSLLLLEQPGSVLQSLSHLSSTSLCMTTRHQTIKTATTTAKEKVHEGKSMQQKKVIKEVYSKHQNDVLQENRENNKYDDYTIEKNSSNENVKEQEEQEQASFSSSSIPTRTTSFHLISLNWTKSDIHFSKTIKDVWRWKDSVLGDGRDFFVPKPKTLSALNQFLVDDVPNVQECVVLSNCARFEILVTWKDDYPNEMKSETDIQASGRGRRVRRAISQSIAKQVRFHNDRRTSSSIVNLFQEQLSSFDWPDMISLDTTKTKTERNNNYKNGDGDHEKTSNEIERYWTHIEGVEAICRYLSRIAAGIAERPNRPDKVVLFRPFSSRDAHILLQLKRTAEVAVGASVKTILDSAISAGKAVRDPRKVPQIVQLKKYSNGSNTKYSQGDVPVALSNEIAKAAMELAVEPLVTKTVAKFQAKSMTDAITRLQQSGLNMAQTETERKLIRKLLHQPTLQLRQGQKVPESQVLAKVQIELDRARKISSM